MAHDQKQIQSKLQLEQQVLSSQLHNRQSQAMSGSVNAVNIQLQGKLEVRLACIERALLRLKKGTFGVCQICGNEIDAARLEALPYAEQCIDCQRRLERKTIRPYTSHLYLMQ